MKSTVVWALIILNAALLLSFVWRISPDNKAMAQRAGAPPRPGDYIMLSADVTGANAGIVVIIDQTNAELSAFSYDDANRNFGWMQKVSLRQLFEGAGGAPARRGTRY